MVAPAVQGINLFKIAGRLISHIQQLQTISDDNDDFVPAGEMVERLMQDNAHLVKT